LHATPVLATKQGKRGFAAESATACGGFVRGEAGTPKKIEK